MTDGPARPDDRPGQTDTWLRDNDAWLGAAIAHLRLTLAARAAARNAPPPGPPVAATVALDAEPEPPRMGAEITACSFTDDGQAYRDAQLAAARAAMWPRFTDRHYGRPGYGQLHACTDPGILEGASDAAEMGAFHDLFQPQRHAALAARLDDNLPAGMAAGIIFVT